MEFGAFTQLTFHVNAAFHGVNNIFGDRHAQPGAFRLVHSPVIRPRVGFKDFGYKFR